MDIVDHAQKIAEEALQRTLNENKAKFAGEDVDFIHCLECGVKIPEERREAIHSCKYCVDCQELKERKEKHYKAR